MSITIIRGRSNFVRFDVPWSGPQCHICGLYFPEMTPHPEFEAHLMRCVDHKAAEDRQMIAQGYRKTSKGWVLNGR